MRGVKLYDHMICFAPTGCELVALRRLLKCVEGGRAGGGGIGNDKLCNAGAWKEYLGVW